LAPPTTIRFHSTGNPTGLKFEVEHGGARAIFDFGLEHAPGRAPFSMGLRPRPGRELADLLAVGAAPRLEGVYAGGRWDGRTAVFISHMHLDHTSLVRFLHPEVPLFYPAAMEPLRAAAEASAYLPWRSPAGTPVPDRETVRWGDVEITFLAVDHDLPGATGFLVRTPDLAAAYTGDHRWHGFEPALTAGFAEAVRGVDVLIQEAVAAGLDRPAAAPPPPPPELSEPEVVAGVGDALGSATGLALINAYPMNRARLAAVAEVAAGLGRRLVMEPQAAALAGRNELFDAEAVAADPRSHLVQLSFESLPLLIDLPRPPGSVYLHSNGMPLSEYDPAFGVMVAWTRVTGLDLQRIGSSGHSRPADLPRMAERVRPGVLMPVHSRFPEALEVPGVRRILPEAGRAYTREDLRAAQPD
jgi:ribonuclease J